MKQNKVPKVEYHKGEPSDKKPSPYRYDRIVDETVVNDSMGYWNPDNFGKIVQFSAPDGRVSMNNVNFPVMAISNKGEYNMQMPGQEYQYEGDFITEYPMAKNGGWLDSLPMAQNGKIKTPEGWEKEIRAVEKRIGDPSTWTLDSYKTLQDKLNEYKAWRENTAEGKAVVDYHNEPNEYVVPLPEQLKDPNMNYEKDLISKVLMNRNRDKDFVKRAYDVGAYPNSNMFTGLDTEDFGNRMSHKMSWGEDESGQAYMYPNIYNSNNEAIKIPNQYADYISSEGYKKATGIPVEKNGGGLLNKTLTCPSCGWSWKAVDGGKDIATCHKCGGTAKLAYGGDLPMAQKGKTHKDSVAHQADKILKYEQLRGGPGGTPLSYYGDPKYKKMLMDEVYPEVNKIMPNASAMEKGEAMDFIFNAGWDKNNNAILKDPRAYALQEYYKKYNPYKLDSEGKWSGRKGAPYSFDEEYTATIGKLPENERRVLMNQGRDWYYKNTNNPSPGVPNSNYYDTWYGRIWNTNDYSEFDPKNPKFTYRKKAYGGDPSLPNIEDHYPFGGQNSKTGTHFEEGGWLDKYQGKVGGNQVPKDRRQIPQSGMVIDKRTNEAYYFGDKGETGNFPVLTGLNPELNSNTYSPTFLNQNPQYKNTPTGYYMMEQGLPKTPYTNTYYNGRIRPMEPITAFGVGAPDAEDLSMHNTFSDPSKPSIFNSRNKMYSAPGDKRYVSQGCINCQKESYDAFNKAIPHDDTLMVLDSKNLLDLELLKKAQARMKKKQEGGWLDDEEFRRGGQRRRRGTSKNIQSSINDLFRRNYDVYGPAGKNRYNPTAYKTGGWLDNVD